MITENAIEPFKIKIGSAGAVGAVQQGSCKAAWASGGGAFMTHADGTAQILVNICTLALAHYR